MIYIDLNVILPFKREIEIKIYIGIRQTSKPLVKFDLKLNFQKERIKGETNNTDQVNRMRKETRTD